MLSRLHKHTVAHLYLPTHKHTHKIKTKTLNEASDTIRARAQFDFTPCVLCEVVFSHMSSGPRGYLLASVPLFKDKEAVMAELESGSRGSLSRASEPFPSLSSLLLGDIHCVPITEALQTWKPEPTTAQS